MEIYIAVDGRVLSYILDPMFEKYLPIIPAEVSCNSFFHLVIPCVFDCHEQQQQLTDARIPSSSRRYC